MKKRLVAAVLALAFGASQASAALPPCAIDQMVMEATQVAQIKVLSVGPPQRAGNFEICRVDGTVVRSFRGPAQAGTPASVRITCGVVEPMPGPTVYFDREALENFPYLELHLDAAGHPTGHGAGVVGLAAPTGEIAYRRRC